MIQPNEIRIGNIVNQLPVTETLQSGKKVTVRSGNEVTVTTSNIQFIVNGAYGYEGIPLTEEWLLRFGFEETTVDWWVNRDVGVSICITTTPHRLMLWRQEREVVIQKDILFVHTFQNFVFANTGEELTVKTEVSNG